MAKNEEKLNTFAVIGAGAVGGFYGAKLARKVRKVQFQSQFLAESPVNKPLKIKSIWGNFSIKADIHASTQSMSSADVLIISVKVLPNIDYKVLLAPFFKDNPHKPQIIICLQNGIHQETKIKKKFPNARVIGAVAFTCIYRKSYREIFHVDYGLVKIAPFEKADIHLTRTMKALFNQCGIKCEMETNLTRLRWQKLVWNIPFNPLSIILNCATTKDMLDDREICSLIRAIMKEILIIAKSDGVPLPQRYIQELIAKTKNMKPYKTSMLYDYEQNKPIEIQAILGEPLKIARKNKISAPRIEMLYQLLMYIHRKRQFMPLV